MKQIMKPKRSTENKKQTPYSSDKLNDAYQDPCVFAKRFVDSMSLREKIGQLLMLDFRYWGTNDDKSPKSPKSLSHMADDLQQVIRDHHLGGVALFRENLYSTEQTIALIQGFQNARSNFPLFIAVDQEGGYVTRLREGTEMPGNMAVAATRNPKLAEMSGQVHGLELSSLGINFNFAPVIDVNAQQNNPVIGVRAYADNLALIDQMAKAYTKGIHQYGVLTSVKHFPGHGNVSVDPHFSLPYVSYSKDQWTCTDLQAFKNAFIYNQDSVMTAHVVVPCIDDDKLTSPLTGEVIGTPATLSKKILTGILRDELNYQGLIITDAIDMGAIANYFEAPWTVKQAILAGADIILMPVHVWGVEDIKKLGAIFNYLEQECKSIPALSERITASALRVILSKLSNKISAQPVSYSAAKKNVGSIENKGKEIQLAERAVTLIENQNILPFKLNQRTKCLILSDEQSRNNLVINEINKITNDALNSDLSIEDRVISMNSSVLDEKQLSDLKKQIEAADFVLLLTYNLSATSTINNAQHIINMSNQLSIPCVVIASRNPYDIAYLKGVKANIAVYGVTGFDVTNNNRNKLEANMRAGVRSLFMLANDNTPLNEPTGQLPVDIKSSDGKTVLYPFGHGLSYTRTQ
ncbi:MAG: glycoside hydrolase family 3 protein [Psychromonas sp.]|nr:glycoside hydrolase family 3 protein [Psychromonas sp.]